MSLGIDIDLVSHVLLADGWYSVVDHSFALDGYEYFSYHRNDPDDPNAHHVLHGAGTPGDAPTGFSFQVAPRRGTDDKIGDLIGGPITSILAVRYRSRV
jgi:hypothetical protein